MICIEKRRKRKDGVKLDDFLYYVVEEMGDKKYILAKCGGDEKLAIELRGKFRAQRVLGDNGFPAQMKILLGDAAEKYLDSFRKVAAKDQSPNKSKQATYIRYKWGIDKLVGHFGGERLLASIRDTDMHDFRDALLDGHETNGMRNIIKYSCSFFALCVRKKWTVSSPTAGILREKKFKEVEVWRFLTDHESRVVVSVCLITHPHKDDTLQDIVKTALMTGFRENEVSAIRWSWLRDGKIYAPREYTKSQRPRVIKIHPDLEPVLEKYHRPGEDVIFKGWSAGRIRQAFIRHMKMGREDDVLTGRIRFHDLRHTFASNFLKDNPGQVEKLKEVLGHRSLATTMRYVHVNQPEIDMAIDNMKNAFMETPAPKLQIV